MFQYTRLTQRTPIKAGLATATKLAISVSVLIAFFAAVQPDRDLHRAKPGLTPSLAQLENDLSKSLEMGNAGISYVHAALDKAIRMVGNRDSELARKLAEIRDSIVVRAGPFAYIWGSFSNNILYLDITLLDPSAERELIVTLIHEAGAALGRADADNEVFAQASVATTRNIFQEETLPEMIKKAVGSIAHSLTVLLHQLNKLESTPKENRGHGHEKRVNEIKKKIEELINMVNAIAGITPAQIATRIRDGAAYYNQHFAGLRLQIRLFRSIW